MKKTTLFLSTVLSLLFSCNNDKSVDKDVPKSGNTVIKSAVEENKNCITNLESTFSKEIIGLWKLYKTVNQDSSYTIERENRFIEIKKGREVQIDNKGGWWFLSFCRDTASITALFTLLQSHWSKEIEVTTYRIFKVSENNTNYLKLIALTDGKEYFYIRQQ